MAIKLPSAIRASDANLETLRSNVFIDDALKLLRRFMHLPEITNEFVPCDIFNAGYDESLAPEGRFVQSMNNLNASPLGYQYNLARHVATLGPRNSTQKSSRSLAMQAVWSKIFSPGGRP